MNFVSHASQAEADDFPVLPGNLQRSDVQRILRRVAPTLGMTDGQLAVTLALIDETRPSDWTDPRFEPVCFSMQVNIATLTGKDERTVRRVEAALESNFGFIRKDVAMNGRRCRFRRSDGSEYRQGIVFTPLIEAMPRLIQLEAELASGRMDRAVLKQKISAAKRLIKTKLIDLQPQFPTDMALRKVADTFLSWPTRFPASVSVHDLREHFLEVSNVVDRLLAFTAQEMEMSAGPDKGARQYIQDTTQTSSVSCNASVSQRTARKRADGDFETAPPDGDADCLESNDRGIAPDEKRNLHDALTPARLFHLCTEEMQVRVQVSQGVRPFPDVRDFTNGAIDRLLPLGIHPSAYRDAADQMGEFAASLCVLIIDRNRFHPVTPIRNPGGALRAMTRRHARQELSLERSLFGLLRRGSLD